MALQDTDKFLVNRSNQSYQVEAKNLMALQDTDLLLVNRNNTSYKVTASELKAGLKSPKVLDSQLFQGNGTATNIVNDFNMTTEGGLVIAKSVSPSNTAGWYLTDTVRGVRSVLRSPGTDQAFNKDIVTAFRSDGFTAGPDGQTNSASFKTSFTTFVKRPKLFDIVRYTGNGSTQNISHSLGVKPGMIWLRPLNGGNWYVYHMGPGASKFAYLNLTNSWVTSSSGIWDNNEPNTSTFYTGSSINSSGQQYVAYLFAQDGDGIKCGTYMGNATTNQIDIGFMPKWVLIRKDVSSGPWNVADAEFASNQRLAFNSTSGLTENYQNIQFNPKGFRLSDSNSDENQNGFPYIYMALEQDF